MASRVLNQIRQQNPGFADKPDHEVAREVYEQNYSDLDFDDFASRVELSPLDRVRAKDPERADKSDQQLANELYQQEYSDLEYRDFIERVGIEIPGATEPGTPQSRTGPGPARNGDDEVGQREMPDIQGSAADLLDRATQTENADPRGRERREGREQPQVPEAQDLAGGAQRREERPISELPTVEEPRPTRRERRARNQSEETDIGQRFDSTRQDGIEGAASFDKVASLSLIGEPMRSDMGVSEAELAVERDRPWKERLGEDLETGWLQLRSGLETLNAVTNTMRSIEDRAERLRELENAGADARQRLAGAQTEGERQVAESNERRVLAEQQNLPELRREQQEEIERFEGQLASIAELQSRKQEIGGNPFVRQAIETGDAGEFLKRLKQDPLATMSGLLLESGPITALSVGSSVALGRAFGPGGFAVGAGVGSSVAEFSLVLEEKIQEYGGDFSDPDSVRQVMDEYGDEIIKDSGLMAGAVGVMDALGGKAASSQILPSAGAGASATRRLGRFTGEQATQATIQAGTGGAGNLFGQAMTEEEINGAEVMAEAVAEFGFAPVEVGAAGISQARRSITEDNRSFGRKLTDGGFEDQGGGRYRRGNVEVQVGDGEAVARFVTNPSVSEEEGGGSDTPDDDLPEATPSDQTPVGARPQQAQTADEELGFILDEFGGEQPTGPQSNPEQGQSQVPDVDTQLDDINRQLSQRRESLRSAGVPDDQAEADPRVQQLIQISQSLDEVRRQSESRAAEQSANTTIDADRAPTDDALGLQVQSIRQEAEARSPLRDEIERLRERARAPAADPQIAPVQQPDLEPAPEQPRPAPAIAQPSPDPTVRANGQPFSSEASASRSRAFKQATNPQVVPVGEGFGVIEAGEPASVDAEQPSDRPVDDINPSERQNQESLQSQIQGIDNALSADLPRAARDTLVRQRDTLQRELDNNQPRQTQAERMRRQLVVRPGTDDVVTAIQKLGGIDTAEETEFDGRLNSFRNRTPGLPALERPNRGRSLDDLAESLMEVGYLESRNKNELYEVLERVEQGQTVYSREVESRLMEEQMPSEPPVESADFEAQRIDQQLDEENEILSLADEYQGSQAGDRFEESDYTAGIRDEQRALNEAIRVGYEYDAERTDRIVNEGEDALLPESQIARRIDNEVIQPGQQQERADAEGDSGGRQGAQPSRREAQVQEGREPLDPSEGQVDGDPDVRFARRNTIQDGLENAFGGQETPATALSDTAATIQVDGVERPARNSEGRAIHWSEEGVRNFWRWFGDSRAVDGEGRPKVLYHGTSQDFTSFDAGMRGASTGAESAQSGFYFTSSPDVAEGFSTLARRRIQSDEGGAPSIVPVYLQLADVIETRGQDVSIEETVSDAVEQGRDGAILYDIDDSAKNPRVTIDGVVRGEVDPDGAFLGEDLPAWQAGEGVTREEIQERLDGQVEFVETEIRGFEEEISDADTPASRRVLEEELDDYRAQLQVFQDLAEAWRDNPDRVSVDRGVSDVFVVFEPEQIKSAIGNSGTFNGVDGRVNFSRGQGASGIDANEAAARARQLMGDWKIAPEVNVVQSEDSLPKAAREKINANNAQGQVRGVFHQGEVHVVADNVESFDQVEEVILHEILGHFGIRNVLGRQMNKVLDDAYLTIGRTALADIASRYNLNLDNTSQRREAVEEYLAQMAESTPDATIVDRIVRMIADWARSMGFNLNMTNAEIRELMTRARRFTQDGEIVTGVTVGAPISGGISVNAQGMAGSEQARFSIARAVDKANAKGEAVRVSTEEKFFGEVWPKYLRTTGLKRSPSARNVRRAAKQAIADMEGWVKENPQFQDYYAADMEATREIVESTFGAISDEQFDFFKVMLGLNSPSTGLRSNISDAFNVMDLYLREGNLDSIKMGRSAKNNAVIASSPFQISAPTAPTKARAMKVVDQVIKDKGSIQEAIDFFQEEVSVSELHAFNREAGYSGQVGGIGRIKSLVRGATGQDQRIPRMFIFGEKVGAYTLNTLGDSRYTTIDIWEGRFIRSYFDGMFEQGTGLPVNDDEHALFTEFNAIFGEEMEAKFGVGFEASALQAMRWFYMINAAKEAGYANARTDSTISGYARQIANQRFGAQDNGSRRRRDEETDEATSALDSPRFSLADSAAPTHRPLSADSGAATIDDLTQSFPEDIYSSNALQFYGSGDPKERAVLQTLRRVRGKPDSQVTVYRGVPEGANEIRAGDWVTLSREYAEEHIEALGGGRVLAKRVPASSVTAWADSLLENGYFPDGEPVRADDDVRFAMAGENAFTADANSLARAREMRQRRMSNHMVLRETGWFEGTDGIMRFEIDDSEAMLKSHKVVSTGDVMNELVGKTTIEPADDGSGFVRASYGQGDSYVGAFGRTEEQAYENLARSIAKQRTPSNAFDPDRLERVEGEYRLGQILSHDRLFAAYPDLQDIPVHVRPMGDALGSYSHAEDRMSIAQARVPATPDSESRKASRVDFTSTLMHEIQHAIQAREGFAQGGNPSRETWESIRAGIDQLSANVVNSVLEWQYNNPGAEDRANQASFNATMGLMHQSAKRLREYAARPRPSGVFRLIKREAQWIYEPGMDGTEAGQKVQQKFYGIPSRGEARNKRISEIAYESAELIESQIPESLRAEFDNDNRKLENMVKALDREARRERENVAELNQLSREAQRLRGLKDSGVLSNPYRTYSALAGEVEARNVQSRQMMDARARADVPPRETQDVPDEQVIVMVGGKEFRVPRSMASVTEDQDVRFSKRAAREATSSKVANAAANRNGMPTKHRNDAAKETTAWVGKDRRGRWVEVQTSHPSLREQGRLRAWLKKGFTKEGQLTESAYRAHTRMLGERNAAEIDISGFSADFMRAVSREYGRSYMNISDSEKESLNNYLAGVDVQGIPQSVKNELDVMRGMLDNASQRVQLMLLDEVRYALQDLPGERAAEVAELIRRATREDESAIDEIRESGRHGDLIARKLRTFLAIRANEGRYLHRSYRAFDDDTWKDNVPEDVMRRAREFLRSRFARDPAFEGASPSAIEDSVNGLINAVLNSNSSDMVDFLSQKQLGEKDLSVLRQRENVPEPIRDLMGEYKDPRINFSRTMSHMTTLLASHNFLRTVREEGLGEFLSASPSGRMSKQISAFDEEKLLPLAGLYATPEFRQEMIDFASNDSMGAFVDTLISLNSAIKYGKTVISPTTMARNFYSATMFTVANGHFDYRNVVKAAQTTYSDISGNTKKHRDYMRKLAGLGVIHDSARAGELRAALEDMMEMDTTQGSAPMRGVKRALNIATSMYQAGDDFWKIVGFESERSDLIKEGMAEPEAEAMAARRIRDGYPTYSMVPQKIQQLRRFPLMGTFVSFPWEIMRNTFAQFNMAVEDYERGNYAKAGKRAFGMAAAHSVSYAIATTTMSIFGIDWEEDEAIRKLAAPWQMNSQFAYLGHDEDGRMRYLDISHLDPYNHMKRPLTALLNGNYDSIPEAAAMGVSEFLSPYLGADIGATALAEVFLNTKQGSDASVRDPYADIFTQGAEVFNHVRESTQPGIFANIERTLMAFNEQMTSYGREYTLSDEGLAWVGFRLTTSDPAVSMQFKALDFDDQRITAGRPTYALLRDPNKVSSSDVEDAVERSNERFSAAFNEMHTVVRAARVAGMTDQEIAESLQKGGVPKKHLSYIIQGRVPPWVPSDQSIQNSINSVLQYNDTPEMRENLRERFEALGRAVTEQANRLREEQEQ